MEGSFLSVNSVNKRFAHHVALNDVSLDVKRGRVFGLLGPNGAGKTTLIRIINRITAPDSGTVTFDGHSFLPEDVQRIGYLPEERGLYKKMKVGEQAVYLARLKGLSKQEAQQRLRDWFERFDIMPWWNKKLEELSKGMQQKVQFIITVLHEPPLLIFDEPFSGFDPLNAEQLKTEILRLRDKGHTIIFSTHNMGSVEEICDEIALINQGRVVLRGNVADVKRSFRSGVCELITSGTDTLAADHNAYTIMQTEMLRDGGVRYLVKRNPHLESNSALVAALAGQVEIRSFCEQLPSMNDIFIRTVQATAQGPASEDN